MPRNENKKKCKARSRNGEQCKRWAKTGWDVCHYHGAGGGASPGNKNAVTTGEYETIWLDALDDDERVLFHAVDTDVIRQLDQEIRLLEIRERRMLKRIQNVMSGWEEDDIESRYELRKKKNGAFPVFSENGDMQMFPTSEENLVEVERTTRKRSKLERIVAIEEALTRVQKEKAKLLELKHKILSGGRDDANSLESLVQAIRESGDT